MTQPLLDAASIIVGRLFRQARVAVVGAHRYLLAEVFFHGYPYEQFWGAKSLAG